MTADHLEGRLLEPRAGLHGDSLESATPVAALFSLRALKAANGDL
jgi:hypothetical protein